MMTAVTIDATNSAFDPDPRPEIARILRELADRIASAATLEALDNLKLYDENGNSVGSFNVVDI